ncbi:MAG: DNA primase [Coriobacteriales bacterium]|nr:DNA primase [Coriobacteriales bacterium]
MITDEDKERVRKSTDIVQLISETVELRQRGADMWGCCPFHHEKSPSFHVNPSTGLWKCFGCGLGGDVFGYVMHRENLSFPDAIRFLADRAGIELVEERGARRGPKRNRLIECLAEARSYYATMLNRGKGRGPAEARKYLAGRGFGSSVCRRWNLGFAPGYGMLTKHLLAKGFSRQELEAADLAIMRNGRLADRFYDRVMFPIEDEQGRTIAFGGRVLGDAKPKYLNTKETSVFHKGKHLFALDKAKEHIVARQEAIVCEGYTDVMALHEAGFPIAVAALGTSFSVDHVRTLARFAKRIICMFDGDAAGQRAAERAIQFLDKSEADLRCVVLPDNQDPAEFLASHRPRDLEEILAQAEPLMRFVLRKRLEDVDPSSPAGVRAAALDKIAGVLVPLRESYVFEEYALQVADRLGFSVEDVKKAILAKPKPQDAPETSYANKGYLGGSVGTASNQRYGNRGNAWGRSSSQAPAAPVAAPAWQGDPGFDEVEVPFDYLPAEAMVGYPAEQPQTMAPAPQPMAAAQPTTVFTPSANERVQLQAERELLALMACNLDALRPEAERIAQFSWADDKHESMAWAMLATPVGTSSDEVVRAACAVVEEAPQILASGEVAASANMSEEEKIRFVLDAVELYSTRRKIVVLRARLRAGDANSSQDFVEATRLQQHANELSRRLSGAR